MGNPDAVGAQSRYRSLTRTLTRQTELSDEDAAHARLRELLYGTAVDTGRAMVGWTTWMVLLWTFVEREGHALVPSVHTEDGRNLGEFVAKCRKRFNAGRVPADRVAELNAVPGWSWNLADRSHRIQVDALDHFVAREGHARVHLHHEEGDVRLGASVAKWRYQYKGGLLSPARVAELSAKPGWLWDPVEHDFQLLLRSLDTYVARTGNACVPIFHIEDGVFLGERVSQLRSRRKVGVLPIHRAQALEGRAGWVWAVR